MYDYLYWLIGTVNKSGGDIIRLSAVIRGVESAGQAISYGINSIDSAKFALSGAVAVNMSFFFVCIVPAAFVIWQVGIVNGVKVHAIVQDEDPQEAAQIEAKIDPAKAQEILKRAEET